MKIRFAWALSTVFFGQTAWTESVPEAIARIEAELEALKSGLQDGVSSLDVGNLRISSDGGQYAQLFAHGVGEKSRAGLFVRTPPQIDPLSLHFIGEPVGTTDI